MDTEAWLRLVQLVIAASGLIAVILMVREIHSASSAVNGGDDSPGRKRP